MVEVTERQSVDGALRLATDLCLALGAFATAVTGTVHVYVSEADLPDDVSARVERLARACLSHPAAHGRALFWNAELSTETGDAAAPDGSLACAVLPVWTEQAQVGLLGIVDTWLPEPDEDQRAGLTALAADLARAMPLRPDRTPGPAVVPGPEPGVGPAPAAGADAVAQPPEEDAAPSAPAGLPAVAAEALVAALDDAVVCLDGSGRVVLANRAAEALYGVGPEATLVGSRLPPARSFRTEDGEPLDPDEHPVELALRDGVDRVERFLVGEKDVEHRLEVSVRAFTVGGDDGVLMVVHDTTAEWLDRRRLSAYAMYDPLTGLANRYLLSEELRRMLQTLGRRGGSVSLVYLDLDKFKLINDEHGHDVGDEVLGAVAGRLRGAVRGDDVVARLGGDEFVIAHAGTETTPDGDLVVSRLRKVLSAPFRVRGQAFDVGASIGWVSTERGEIGPDALLAKADRAMYQAKRARAAQGAPR